MKTYQAVRAEIAKLEKQAEDLRRQELKSVIAQVRQVIADYGLTAADLGLGGTRTRAVATGRKRAAPAGRRASAGVAKYRDPKTGQTWTGHGRPPAWIVSAKDRNAFLIGAAAAPAKAAKKAKAKPEKAAKVAKATKPAAKKSAKTRATARAKKARAAAKSGAVQIESGVAAQ
jgi:DNA-binding protein H-NS